MNRDQRQRQMLGSLPLPLQDGRNVGDFFGRLADLFSGGAEVGGVEYGLTRLLRSRWHREAKGWTGEVTAGTDEATARTSELGRIGVLFGCPPGFPMPSSKASRIILIKIPRRRVNNTPNPWR